MQAIFQKIIVNQNINLYNDIKNAFQGNELEIPNGQDAIVGDLISSGRKTLKIILSSLSDKIEARDASTRNFVEEQPSNKNYKYVLNGCFLLIKNSYIVFCGYRANYEKKVHNFLYKALETKRENIYFQNIAPKDISEEIERIGVRATEFKMSFSPSRKMQETSIFSRIKNSLSSDKDYNEIDEDAKMQCVLRFEGKRKWKKDIHIQELMRDKTLEMMFENDDGYEVNSTIHLNNGRVIKSDELIRKKKINIKKPMENIEKVFEGLEDFCNSQIREVE